MRIGVDLLAIQAPSCRGRGIGRYAESLLLALLGEPDGPELVFYRRNDLGIDWDRARDGPHLRWVDVGPDPADEPDGTLQRIVQRNPDGLDWLLVPNPLVERDGFALPEPVPGGPRLAAVVLDLIPALFPRHYLDAPGLAASYARDLRRLQAYDLILAISEATGRDVRDRLGVPDRRIANIRAACDLEFFRPAATGEEQAADSLRLERHGLIEPFLYYLGNVDWRKNVIGLVEAYALLTGALRTTHPLVLTFGPSVWFRAVLAETVERLGLAGRVLVTGPATDEDVRAFARRAELVLSPSLYEGFGLPTLEAMSCGAAVVAADNSSQPEVVGPAGMLLPDGAAPAWARAIEALLNDKGRLAEMRAASRRQAATFSWRDTARRLLAALKSVAPRPLRPAPDRLVVALYASPREPGYDADSARLVEALAGRVGVATFLETDRATTLPPLPTRAGWYESRLMGRVRPVLGDPPVIHVVDRLESAGPLIEALRAHPGLVAFANRDGAAPDDFDLRRVMGLATGFACRSEPLRGRLAALDPSKPVHLLTATDGPAAAEALAALARLPENRRCPT